MAFADSISRSEQHRRSLTAALMRRLFHRAVMPRGHIELFQAEVPTSPPKQFYPLVKRKRCIDMSGGEIPRQRNNCFPSPAIFGQLSGIFCERRVQQANQTIPCAIPAPMRRSCFIAKDIRDPLDSVYPEPRAGHPLARKLENSAMFSSSLAKWASAHAL